jgi:hypothetical protein
LKFSVAIDMINSLKNGGKLMKSQTTRFGMILGLGMLLGMPLSYGKGNYINFKITVFNDAKCTDKKGDIEVNTKPKHCSSYSYTDSKGVVTHGSIGNVRCYQDRIVVDKFPFDPNCSPSGEHTNLNYTIPAEGHCQEAPSHEGSVYESLTGYKYPGNKECKKKKS